MVIYFSKMYQSIPGLVSIYKHVGGIFVTTRTSTYLKIKQNYPSIPVRLYKEKVPFLSQTRQLLESASVIVTGSPLKSFLENFTAKKVMIFHGTYAYVNSDELKRIDHFDYYFSIGKRLSSFLAMGNFKGKTIDSGYLPFLEYKLFTSEDRLNYLKSLNLSPNKLTVLYMPRGKDFGTWDVMAERLINELSIDFNLILRPHPSQSTKFNLRDIFKNFSIKSKLKKRPFSIIDLCDYPISDIFNISDVLICDGASSPEESLFYNLPTVLIESAKSSRSAIRKQLESSGKTPSEIEQLLSIYDCGTIMQVDDDLNQSLQTALSDNNNKIEKQNEYFEWVFGSRDTLRQEYALKLLLDLK